MAVGQTTIWDVRPVVFQLGDYLTVYLAIVGTGSMNLYSLGDLFDGQTELVVT